MKILVADKIADITIDALKQVGAELTIDPSLSAEALPDVVGDAEIIIVRSTKVSADTLKAGKSLSLIIRAGAGVNTIDVACASERGVHVANCPGTNTDAVSELALGMLIASDRRIANATCDMRAGKWRKKAYGQSRGLKTRTLGILGFGAIGQATAERATALGMHVVAWSRSLTPEKAAACGVGYCDSPLELAGISDALSVHIAAKAETKHMINAEFLAKMKAGAILINTSRGEVVDTAALKEAIASKHLRVGLDVFENEPTSGEDVFADTELAELITCSPHIGASTDQAAEAVGEAVVHIVRTYKETGQAVNCVNLRDKTSAIVNLVVRHMNRVGVLADVLTTLRTDRVNIEEMQNTIFDGGKAACCTLKLDSEPSTDAIAQINATANVIQASLK